MSIAKRYEVAGFVRNLPDGRVELVAEGEREELDRFLAEIDEKMRGFIVSCQVEASSPTGGFNQFRILH